MGCNIRKINNFGMKQSDRRREKWLIEDFFMVLASKFSFPCISILYKKNSWSFPNAQMRLSTDVEKGWSRSWHLGTRRAF